MELKWKVCLDNGWFSEQITQSILDNVPYYIKETFGVEWGVMQRLRYDVSRTPISVIQFL